MSDTLEHTWKSQFIARLAELFVEDGLDLDAAIADAQAHADDCYPQRKMGEPDEEASSLHRELKSSALGLDPASC